MPFEGCASRCLFCAQDKFGSLAGQPITVRLQEVQRKLAMPSCSVQRELAFYGGTFTRCEPDTQKACLAVASHALEQGHIVAARCSTRPDAVSKDQLLLLKKSGITLIELGVQSFQDSALSASCRGYTGDEAVQGCRSVRQQGFALGIQLLPGMPGLTSNAFLEDVETALSLSPACLRLYPCLVLKGTALAKLWAEGHYRPWSLEETVSTLAEALRKAWQAGVPVIRMGLAPDPALDETVLAGPRHPALGSLVQGEAMLQTVRHSLENVQGIRAFRLALPRQCQGFFYGHKGSLKAQWAELGLTKVDWHLNNNGAWWSV